MVSRPETTTSNPSSGLTARREAALRQDARLRVSPEDGAALLTAFVEGRMQQFVRSRFERASLDAWEADWAVLRHGLFDAGEMPANPIVSD